MVAFGHGLHTESCKHNYQISLLHCFAQFSMIIRNDDDNDNGNGVNIDDYNQSASRNGCKVQILIMCLLLMWNLII